MTIAIETGAMSADLWKLDTKISHLQHSSVRLKGGLQLPIAESLNAETGRIEPLPVHSIDLQLFDNAAELKRRMSIIAMHLPISLRDTIRNQVDRLLSLEHWEEDSSLVSSLSFVTFLRFLVHSKAVKLPGLGVSPLAHVLASWHDGNTKLLVNFMPNEKAKATIIRPSDRRDAKAEDFEITGWQGNVASLKHFLARNEVLHCIE